MNRTSKILDRVQSITAQALQNKPAVININEARFVMQKISLSPRSWMWKVVIFTKNLPSKEKNLCALGPQEQSSRIIVSFRRELINIILRKLVRVSSQSEIMYP